MVFKNYKTANLANGRMVAGISASATSMILISGQGGLFPAVFPYLLKLEKFDSTSTLENKPVLKREIVKVTNKSGDTFTIERGVGYCPESDAAVTQTNTAFAFDSNDNVSLVDTSEQYEDIADELLRLETDKADDDEVVKLAGDQTVDGIKTFEESPIVPTPTTDYQASTKKYVDDGITAAQETSELIDDSFMLGEPIIAGQCAFLESGPATGVATTKQNIGDVAGNTRVSFPVIGTGVASDTFKVNICKTGSTHPAGQGLYFRIETDNAGSPSGVLIDLNAIAHILPADLTTSLADTELTLSGAITITEGQKCHLVAFQSTSNDYADTVIDTDYYNIGYHTNDTTTRPLSLYDGSERGNSTDYVGDHGVTLDTNVSSGPGYKYAVKFTVSANAYLTECVKNSYGNIDSCALYSDNGLAVIETATVVGDTATFSGNTELLAGTYYYMTWRVASGSPSFKSKTGVSFPITNNNIVFTQGEEYSAPNGWNENAGNLYAVETITTRIYTPTANNKFCYISSALFQDKLLSLTDSDFAYKVDLQGIAIENKGIGTYPKLTIQGINGEQSGLTPGLSYYLGATPGNLTTTYGSNLFVGNAITDKKLHLLCKDEIIRPGTTYTLTSLPTQRILRNGGVYAKVKSAGIPKGGTYTVSYTIQASGGTSKGRIYKNGVPYGTEITTTGTSTSTENLQFNVGDVCELWGASGTGSSDDIFVRDFSIKYQLVKNTRVSYGDID